jgi:drug/metabolite transporter (DMT)-like permease
LASAHPSANCFSGASTRCYWQGFCISDRVSDWLFGIGVRGLLMRDNSREAGLQRRDLPWLGLAVLSGGIVAPVLLMFGLKLTPASSASLLLNLEGVLTALLTWFVFKENFDRRIFIGMIAILGGGFLLSWEPQRELAVPWGALCICGACFCWAIDNNLTRQVSLADPMHAGQPGSPPASTRGI